MTGVGDPLSRHIRLGCDEMELPLSQLQLDALCNYIKLLDKWNRAYNLTAIRDPQAMVTHHLLDSLSIRPWIGGGRVLDVGTGAGLPGIPLAITCPDTEFSLLDSNGKKIRFLRQLVAELKLENVTLIQQRAQHLVDKAGFDMVLSRAFASLDAMLAGTGHLVAEGGQWLAMKGKYPSEELAKLPADITLQAVRAVDVPGLDAQRHLVFLLRHKPDTVDRGKQL